MERPFINSLGDKNPSLSVSKTLNKRLFINPGRGKKRLNAKGNIPLLEFGEYIDNSLQISDKYKIKIEGGLTWCSLRKDLRTK